MFFFFLKRILILNGTVLDILWRSQMAHFLARQNTAAKAGSISANILFPFSSPLLYLLHYLLCFFLHFFIF